MLWTDQLFDGGVDLEEHCGALLVKDRHIVTAGRATGVPVGGVSEISVGQPPLVRALTQTYKTNYNCRGSFVVVDSFCLFVCLIDATIISDSTWLFFLFDIHSFV